MNGWQPMDTAPRDGSRILVDDPEWPWDRPAIARWTGDTPEGRDSRYYEWQSIDEQCGGSTKIEPVRWAPLPQVIDV